MTLTTDLQIRNWKPSGKQEFKPCGNRLGLYIRGSEAGSKVFYWRKSNRWFALEDYPQMKLSEATELAAVCNQRFKQGLKPDEIIGALRGLEDSSEAIPLNPADARRGRVRQPKRKGAVESYEDAFEAYYEAYAASNLQVGPSRNAPLQWHRNIPVSLKAMPIRDITRSDIFPWMLKLLQTKHETGRKLRGLMDRVFEFAINLGVVNSNPVPPRRAFEVKRPKTRHHATIRPEELPKMWQHISQSGAGGAMKLLLKLAILSGHRVDVNRLARWDHIDLDSRQWTVPERVDKETEGLMKSGRSHVVTLPQEFLDQMIAGRSDDTYVFVNSNDDPFSENAMLKIVKGYDGECTIHGFRNARKIWGKDIAGFDDWVMDFYEDHEESKGVLDDEYRRRPEETKIARCADVTKALYEFCKNG